MAMMADSKVFIDTNALIYLNNRNHLFHKDVLYTIESLQNEGAYLVISDQTIKEFLVVKSNLLQIENRFDVSILKSDYEFIVKSFAVLPNPENILNRLLSLIGQYKLKGKIIHDAFIAAFCLESGISKIFTVNVKDFTIFSTDGLEIVALRKAKDNE